MNIYISKSENGYTVTSGYYNKGNRKEFSFGGIAELGAFLSGICNSLECDNVGSMVISASCFDREHNILETQ